MATRHTPRRRHGMRSRGGRDDAVTCVCTLMFSPDPARAVREMRRVLKPGGRFGIVVWDSPAVNPFSMLMLDVVGSFIALPPFAGAAVPGPFRFAAAGDLQSVLRAGGCADAALAREVMTFEFASVDEYFDVVTDQAGWRGRIAALGAGELARLETALHEAVRPSLENGRVRLQAAVQCAFGYR